MKYPKYLTKPVELWQEEYGVKRAIKVIEIQAKLHRDNGDKANSDALLEVGLALSKSIIGERVAESVTLNWGKMGEE